MALPRVSSRLPFYDPSKSSLAYGDRALPKLVRCIFGGSSYLIWLSGGLLQNRELQSKELRVRQQALLLLADVMHKRENLSTAIREGELVIESELKVLYSLLNYRSCSYTEGATGR